MRKYRHGNVCNAWFDTVDKIRKHIEKEHKEVTAQISKAINEKDWSESNSGSNNES